MLTVNTNRDLLRNLSSHAEKRFRTHGRLTGFLWVVEDAAGQTEYFETGCEADPSEVTDDMAIKDLKAELRAEFRRDQVTRFGVAFTARVLVTLRQTVLHVHTKQEMRPTVALEVHDIDGAHLSAQRDITFGRLEALVEVPDAPICWGDLL